MENRVERAVTNHDRGYNCAQSVVCAYCELFGMDESAAFRLAEGFGGGMGGMQDGTCGAVTAMYMLAGVKGSSGGVENGISKVETYEQVQKLCAAFKEQNGTVICCELLEKNDMSLERPCNRWIADAARIVEAQLVGDAEAQAQK